MMQRIVLIAALLPLSLATCSRRGSAPAVEPSDRVAYADRLAERGNCRKAVLVYEDLLAEFPPPEIAERAKFSRSRCRVELEDYDLAISELEDFIDTYPQSDLADDAVYLIGLCYLRQSPRAERDQQNTLKAVREFEFMLREYPDSNVREEAQASLMEARGKLGKKEYLNGKLYLRLEYFLAARICFDTVLDEYGDTEWAAWALLGKAQSYEREGNIRKAAELYDKVCTDHPGTEACGTAGMRLHQIAGGNGDGGER